jgi:hypothetical protein
VHERVEDFRALYPRAADAEVRRVRRLPRGVKSKGCGTVSPPKNPTHQISDFTRA